MRLLLLILVSVTLLAQAPGLKQQILEIPRPTSPQLDAADARRMLEAQRMHEHLKAVYFQKKVELAEAEKAANEAGDKVDALLGELRAKYHCGLCDLGWDMTWMTRAGSQFASDKKAPPTEE